MSILDGIFKDRQSMEGATQFAQHMVGEAMDGLDAETRRVIELTADGSSLGDVLGITKDQKAALLDLGCRLLQVGETQKATDVLMRLAMYDPLEERAYYALGVASQTQGRLQQAAQMYIQFLALDATNPMGYLRLGECLLAAGEYREAHSVLISAKQFAEEGNGEPGNLDEATRLLSLPEIASAGPSIKS